MVVGPTWGGGGSTCPPGSHPSASPRAVVYLTRLLFWARGQRGGGVGGEKILGLPAPSLLGSGGGGSGLHHSLTSFLPTASLFPCMCAYYIWEGGALCYLGTGMQLHTSQVKTELKTKPQQTQHPCPSGTFHDTFLPPFPPSQGLPP